MKFAATETSNNGARDVGRLVRALRAIGPFIAALVIGTASALAWLDHRIEAHTADEVAPISAALTDIREHISAIERQQLQLAAQLTRVETVVELMRNRKKE